MPSKKNGPRPSSVGAGTANRGAPRRRRVLAALTAWRGSRRRSPAPRDPSATSPVYGGRRTARRAARGAEAERRRSFESKSTPRKSSKTVQASTDDPRGTRGGAATRRERPAPRPREPRDAPLRAGTSATAWACRIRRDLASPASTASNPVARRAIPGPECRQSVDRMFGNTPAARSAPRRARDTSGYRAGYTSAPHAPGAPAVDEPTTIGGRCPAGGYCPLASSFPFPCVFAASLSCSRAPTRENALVKKPRRSGRHVQQRDRRDVRGRVARPSGPVSPWLCFFLQIDVVVREREGRRRRADDPRGIRGGAATRPRTIRAAPSGPSFALAFKTTTSARRRSKTVFASSSRVAQVRELLGGLLLFG